MTLRSWFRRVAFGNPSLGPVAGLGRSALGVGLVAALLLVGSPEPAAGQGADFAGLEVLTVGSTYQEGCFPPCLCPLGVELPVEGTLTLQLEESNPLFTTYAVTDVRWRILSGGAETQVAGSGTYRVGGEVLLTQQLTLDLRLGGGPPTRFDSGVVAGGAEFPAFDVVVSEHGMVCFDRVLRLRARPAPSLPQHAAFALAPNASWVELSLFTGGTRARLRGTLRLLLGDPVAPPALPAGVVAISVEGADLLALNLAPELPGLGRVLQMVRDPTATSVGTLDLGSGEINLDLQLVTPEGNLPVPMPLHLRGRLEGSALTLAGDNGEVADGAIAVTIRAQRVTLREGIASTPAVAQ
jgi:hypothetical protein